MENKMKPKPFKIVIEGIDGSGKETQALLLKEYLISKGYRTAVVSFPRYESLTGQIIRKCLNDELQINDFARSMLFALDRSIYFSDEPESLDNDILIFDRYTPSDFIYTFPKLPQSKWNDYIRDHEIIEYELMGIPKPDVVLYLDVLPSIARKLLEERGELDENELNTDYQYKCRTSAMYLSDHCGWIYVKCFDQNTMLSKDQIHDMVVNSVETELKKYEGV